MTAPAARAAAEDIPRSLLVLEVSSTQGPGDAPEAAPPRFVLMEGGQVFVGGSAELLSGRLEPAEVKAIDKRLAQIRKLPGLGARVRFGPGSTTYRLKVPQPRPLEIVATGDPSAAPVQVRPLADLIRDLALFEHPKLRPHRPDSYALLAREGVLAGGCRRWSFTVPLMESQSSPRLVPSSDARGWPTGTMAASVCDGGKRYIVTLRPILPGERP
jgi:hypothetical protein